MKNIILIKLFVFSLAINTNAQSTVDSVLSGIARNNKSIMANTQYLEVNTMKFKTGLSPVNPDVSFDYMLGSPGIAGNQSDLSITQSFDFPTVYSKKKKLSAQQIAQAGSQLMAKRLEILMEARLTCLELIYQNKLQVHLSQRKQNYEKLLNSFETSLKMGEGNIMDVNKTKLQLIEINREFQQNFSQIKQLNQKLSGLNGGNAIVFSDTVYPDLPAVPVFEQLEKEIQKNDPVLQFLEQEKLISQKQLELSKALSLPRFEAGYRYQGILGQKFQGFHAGITIPLWENKNTVKTSEANLLHVDLNLSEQSNKSYYELKQHYEQYMQLQTTLLEYQGVFSSLNNQSLLYKSLSLGQISTIEYFMEMNYYYSALTNYLQVEKEFHEVIAVLYRYRF